MTEHDFIDILGLDPGVGQSLRRYPHDQAFDGLAIKLTERVWAQPTIAAVIEISFAELWSYWLARNGYGHCSKSPCL